MWRGARSQVETPERPVRDGAGGIRDGEPEGVVACGHRARTPGCVQRRRHAARRHGCSRPMRGEENGPCGRSAYRHEDDHGPQPAGHRTMICLATQDIHRVAQFQGKP